MFRTRTARSAPAVVSSVRVADRTRLAKDVERELREHLPARVFETVVPRSVRIAEAPSYGIPVSLHDPKSKGTRAYRVLADEVLSLQAPDAQVASG